MQASLRADNADNIDQARALMDAHVDVTGAQLVQVEHRNGVVWVNVTLRWSRVCEFVTREASQVLLTLDSPTELVGYCREEQAKATAEGYDDTAQYLQHVIDDLTK